MKRQSLGRLGKIASPLKPCSTLTPKSKNPPDLLGDFLVSEADYQLVSFVVAIMRRERRIALAHRQNARQDGIKVFDQRERFDFIFGDPGGRPFRCSAWRFLFVHFAAKDVNADADMFLGVDRDRAAKPQVWRFQVGFLLKFAPGCAEHVFAQLNVTADAVVTVGPKAFVGRPAKQENLIFTCREDQRPGDEHVAVVGDALVG